MRHEESMGEGSSRCSPARRCVIPRVRARGATGVQVGRVYPAADRAGAHLGHYARASILPRDTLGLERASDQMHACIESECAEEQRRRREPATSSLPFRPSNPI